MCIPYDSAVTLINAYFSLRLGETYTLVPRYVKQWHISLTCNSKMVETVYVFFRRGTAKLNEFIYLMHVYSLVNRNELALDTATEIDLKHTGEWRKKSKSANDKQRKIKMEK